MSFWKQLLMCAVALVVAAGVWMRFFSGSPEDGPAADGGMRGPAGGAASGVVVTAPVETATINDRLTAIGSGRALRSVSVTPFTAGRLTEILVESGSRVEAGSVIARIDSDTEEIALDRANFALEDATARLARIRALRTSNTATQVQLTETELELSNARLGLREAQLALERRSVTAPISGIVGILPVSAGNYVTSQTEVATIDDRSEIVIEFWIPERFAGMVDIGQAVSATSVARPTEQFSGEISAMDNRIDPQSRTLRVQARILNADDALRAGMSFQVTMRFPGDTYPSIDPLAIQWGTDGAFVWVVDAGRAKRVPVQIIQRNTNNVLVSGDLGLDATVVTEGIHNVRDGVEVRIANQQLDPASELQQTQRTGS
ncbi:efflux RND transporter periplasmic adaptor subunit [Aquamicrobium sp. LC103]|uniref:efflux RND transporter periplasmic adaptor subunit n=1 Tax=Aquamicrobium sp. LC103 TaxID=1120658 RepID=UPI00063E8622|nr:efflux RND transporter periplasmic adaptor subunit [Aquamicrobium sp. LC103]TKT77561.1 efflux RND transporter periplasmic adaptor subunit [Aquamicrobium sp. LC103]